MTRHASIPVPPTGTWAPDDVDGAQYATDQNDLTDLPTIHTVYLYAKDAPNRFGDYAAMFQAQQRQSSANLAGATGMGLRWDLRAGTSGDSRLYHDITVLKSRKATFAQLSGSQQFKYASTELKLAGLNLPTKKYLVWVDAPSRYCGESSTPVDTRRVVGNAANGMTVSTLYRYYPVDTVNGNGLKTGGFCAPILHELTHAMGAVSTAAPHFGGGGHCSDSVQDLMCSRTYTPPDQTFDPGAPIEYDYRNDDYLDPIADLKFSSSDYVASKLPWWTVNLSQFLCPRDEATRQPDCAEPNLPDY